MRPSRPVGASPGAFVSRLGAPRVPEWTAPVITVAPVVMAAPAIPANAALPPRTSTAKTGSCSWESKRCPKPRDGVQILAISLADVAEKQGSGFVNRQMLVQFQSSALPTHAGRVPTRKCRRQDLNLHARNGH